MKFKKIFLMLLITLYIIPINVFAYSDKLILGGNNIGIQVKTKGILVVGLYKINNDLIAASSGINTGDYIITVNNNEINSIDDYTKEIYNDPDKQQIDIEYLRNNKIYKTTLNLINQDGEYKTGLYVKDNVTGIGTLTFIDPETKKFGALGHEIVTETNKDILNIDDGSIYYSYITGITKSINGNPGEKEANSDSNNVYGKINENTSKGIFGDYTSEINNQNMYEIAQKNEIKEGKASLFTVINGDSIEAFDIEIEKINLNDDTKNLIFKITDKKLLDKTGGIVQGMSGSPIVQDNKIVGAVTHVIVNDCTKGYGIFITNMLEEAEN